MAKAARLAESILHDYYEQIPGGVRLIPGSGGIFEVSLNGDKLFSKEQTGRFPNENEVEERLESVLDGAAEHRQRKAEGGKAAKAAASRRATPS